MRLYRSSDHLNESFERKSFDATNYEEHEGTIEHLKVVIKEKERDLLLAAEVGEALLQKYNSEVQEFEREIEELNQEKNEYLGSFLQKQKILEQQIKELQEDNQWLKNQQLKAAKTISQLESDLTSTEEEKREIQEKFSQQKTVVSQLKIEVNSSKSPQYDFALEYNKKIEQLENDLQQSQDREKKLRKQVHILKGDYEILQQEYDKLKILEPEIQKNNEISIKYEELEKAHRKTVSELREFKEEHEQIQSIAGDATDLVDVVKELVNAIDKYQKQKETDQELLEEARSEVTHLEKLLEAKGVSTTSSEGEPATFKKFTEIPNFHDKFKNRSSSGIFKQKKKTRVISLGKKADYIKQSLLETKSYTRPRSSSLPSRFKNSNFRSHVTSPDISQSQILFPSQLEAKQKKQSVQVSIGTQTDVYNLYEETMAMLNKRALDDSLHEIRRKRQSSWDINSESNKGRPLQGKGNEKEMKQITQWKMFDQFTPHFGPTKIEGQNSKSKFSRHRAGLDKSRRRDFEKQNEGSQEKNPFQENDERKRSINSNDFFTSAKEILSRDRSRSLRSIPETKNPNDEIQTSISTPALSQSNQTLPSPITENFHENTNTLLTVPTLNKSLSNNLPTHIEKQSSEAFHSLSESNLRSSISFNPNLTTTLTSTTTTTTKSTSHLNDLNSNQTSNQNSITNLTSTITSNSPLNTNSNSITNTNTNTIHNSDKNENIYKSTNLKINESSQIPQVSILNSKSHIINESINSEANIPQTQNFNSNQLQHQNQNHYQNPNQNLNFNINSNSNSTLNINAMVNILPNTNTNTNITNTSLNTTNTTTTNPDIKIDSNLGQQITSLDQNDQKQLFTSNISEIQNNNNQVSKNETQTHSSQVIHDSTQNQSSKFDLSPSNQNSTVNIVNTTTNSNTNINLVFKMNEVIPQDPQKETRFNFDEQFTRTSFNFGPTNNEFKTQDTTNIITLQKPSSIQDFKAQDSIQQQDKNSSQDSKKKEKFNISMETSFQVDESQTLLGQNEEISWPVSPIRKNHSSKRESQPQETTETTSSPKILQQQNSDNDTSSLSKDERLIMILNEFNSELERLCLRLSHTDTVKLNRTLRKGFEIKELTDLSNSMIDNILGDLQELSEDYSDIPLTSLPQQLLWQNGQLRKNLNDFCLTYVLKLNDVAQNESRKVKKERTQTLPPQPSTPQKEEHIDSCIIA